MQYLLIAARLGAPEIWRKQIPSCSLLWMAGGRPEVFGYQPRRHSYIADHPLKMVPGAEIGKKSIFDLPPWGPP